MKIEEFCTHLESRLAAVAVAEERLALAAEAVRQAFRVRADEVAIFSLDPQLEVLAFLWPPKLQSSGVIPLSARDSLAARTVRENKAFLDNRFASARHAFIFEHVRLDAGADGKPSPIQKIISAPLPGSGWVKGALQVSRKGADPAAAGDDFGRADLSALAEIARVIARHL
jgi:hypothetical protein